MSGIIEVIKNNYPFILIFFGVYLITNGFLNSNQNDKKMYHKIIGAILIIIGFIALFL